MADDNYNKKVPESDAEWDYPYNQVIHTLGGHEIFWNSTPDKESYREYHPSGPYREITKDGHKVEVVANKKFSASSNGESRVCEAALDNMILGGERYNNFEGLAQDIAGNYSQGTYGQILKVAKNVLFTYTDNEHHEASAGGAVRDHNDGYAYNNAKESFVNMTTKNAIDGAQEERMIYTGGNYDNYIGKKGRLFSKDKLLLKTDASMNVESKSDMNVNTGAKYVLTVQSSANVSAQEEITITSQTKITLKVGGSKIVIDSSGITIDSSGTVDIKGSGAITTQGSQTKVQGGGQMAPPTTFS